MQKYLIILLIIIGMLNYSSNVSASNSIAAPFIKDQIWLGWYDCGEGKTKLILTIKDVKNSSIGQSVSAVYDFTTQKGVNGVFNTRGRYRSRHQIASFKPSTWIKKAAGYAAPKFKGVVRNDDQSFIGKIHYPGCTEFRLSTSANMDKNQDKAVQAKGTVIVIEKNTSSHKNTLATNNSKTEVKEADSKIELAIASKLSALERLPILYVHESRKWSDIKTLRKNTIGRRLVDKYPFPMNKPVSIEEISKRQMEIQALIKDLEQKERQIQRSMPKNAQGTRELSLQMQHKIATEILYPKVVEIQSKVIDMLSRIPRSKEGFEKAYELKDKLFDKKFGARWNRIITDYTNTRLSYREPVALCTHESTQNQVALDSKTGRCFLEIKFANLLLENAWRIQYAREMDSVWAKQLSDEGAEANLKVFAFTLDIWRKEFSNGLVSFKTAPPNDTSRCLFDKCSSKLIGLYIDETGNKPLTENRKQQYLALIQNKSSELLTRWKNSAGMSKLDRHDIQTDMVDSSRNLARNIIIKLSTSAVKELDSIGKNDFKAYQLWNTKTARPIRQQAEKWRKIWDIGFGISKSDNAASALGLSNFTDGYLRARNTGGSPFVGIAELIFDGQYQWLTNNEKGSVADPDVKFPTSWSASTTYQAPKPPRRYFAQLMTPNELFYDSIGHQLGKLGGAIVSYGSSLRQLEQTIKITRNQFFKCLPNCRDLAVKRAKYSKALLEKDLYFLQVSGGSGSLANQSIRNMSTVVEGFSGSKGASLVDNGIPKICSGYFERWVTKYGESHGRDGRAEIDALFGAMNDMTQGDFSQFKEQGFNLIKKQKEAFSKSEIEYRRYQVCRDQFEFDQFER